MKKALEIGKMYKTPWKVPAYGGVYFAKDTEESEHTTFTYSD